MGHVYAISHMLSSHELLARVPRYECAQRQNKHGENAITATTTTKNLQPKRNYSINNDKHRRHVLYTVHSTQYTASVVRRWHNNMIMTINVWAFLLLLQFTKEFIECIFARRTMFHERQQHNASDIFFTFVRSFVSPSSWAASHSCCALFVPSFSPHLLLQLVC